MTDLELTQVLAGRFAADNAHLPNNVRDVLSEGAAAAMVVVMKVATRYRDAFSVLPSAQRDLPKFRLSWTPEFKQRVASNLSKAQPACASFFSEGPQLARPHKPSSAERVEMARLIISRELDSGRSTFNKLLWHLLKYKTPGLEALTGREFSKALRAVFGHEAGRRPKHKSYVIHRNN